MEALLQKIVKKFLKRIDFSKVKLVLAETGNASEYDDELKDDVKLSVFKIKYSKLTIGSVVTLVGQKAKYLSNIDINPAFRSMGIGGYVIKKHFSGYYIMAGNPRAGRLYARIGKSYSKFTRAEFEQFIDIVGMHGVYKIDSARKR